MAPRFKIEIRPDGFNGSSATFIVEIDSPFLRLVTIDVEIGADGSPLPSQLSDFNFAEYMSIAAALSANNFDDNASSLLGRPEPSESPSLDVISSPDRSQVNPKPREQISQASNLKRSGAPSDLGVTYWRLGSAAKVAKHYDVPQQIARDWIKELRQENKIPNRWGGNPASKSKRFP